jgi:hypothetical protein
VLDFFKDHKQQEKAIGDTENKKILIEKRVLWFLETIVELSFRRFF